MNRNGIPHIMVCKNSIFDVEYSLMEWQTNARLGLKLKRKRVHDRCAAYCTTCITWDLPHTGHSVHFALLIDWLVIYSPSTCVGETRNNTQVQLLRPHLVQRALHSASIPSHDRLLYFLHILSSKNKVQHYFRIETNLNQQFHFKRVFNARVST